MSVAEINNLVIYKGTDFIATFNLFNDDSSRLTLNNLGATYARIRKYPGSTNYEDFGVTITSGTGTIDLTLTPEKTSRLSPGRNYYDIVLTLATKKTEILRGTAIVLESACI